MRIRFEENASPDIAEALAENYIVVLPLGCVEQHGPHLPLNSDWGMDSIIRAAEQAHEKYGAKLLVLPLLPFGPAAEHTGFPGTISLSFETWCSVVVEVLANLVRDGFKRVVVVKGCGGHMGIEGAVFQFYCTKKREIEDLDIRVFGEQAWAEIGKLAADSDVFDPRECHAGGVETSMVLAKTPDSVHLDRLRKPEKQGRSWSWSWWIMEQLSQTGATGDPTRHDVKLGERIIDRMTEVLADFLGDMWHQACSD